MYRLSSLLPRLRRWHWATLGLSLLTALALVLIVVPGEYVDAYRRECRTDWDEQCKRLYLSTRDLHEQTVRHLNPLSAHAEVQIVEHGWPRPFLARALVLKQTSSGRPYRVSSIPRVRFPSTFQSWGGPLYFDVSWSNYDNWPFSADEWILQPWALAIDITSAILIAVLVGSAAEWSLRGRTRRLHYYVSDLIGIVTLISVLLGIYTYHAKTRSVEAQGNTPPLPPSFVSHNGDLTSGQQYFGPIWLRKLAGNASLLPLFHHVYDVSVGFSEKWREVYRELPSHPYLESVWIRDVLPLEALEDLADCRRLKELHLPSFDSKAVVRMQSTSVPMFSVDHLPLLAPLNLTSIGLAGDHIRAEHLEQVASFPAVRNISLLSVSASRQEIDAVRARHPKVTIVVQPDFDRYLSP